jgi:hypothetical protein
VNTNDAKIRNNRSAFCAHFGIFSGGSHIIIGNHIFPDGGGSPTLRRAGLIFTTPNVRGFILGNYIDHCFIELSNEYDENPNSGASYTFGGLSITGNLFLCSDVSPAFRFLTVSPKGSGHSLNGLTVANNTFRSSEGSIERVEMVDTSNGTLNTASFRNVVFANNTFTGISQATVSPIYVEHTQNSADATWVVDAADYLPFGGRARNVESVVLEGPVRDAGNTVQWAQPYVEVEQGTGGRFANLRWPSALKGRAMVTVRCDNPL